MLGDGMERRLNKEPVRSRATSEKAREARSRAVRAIVFMNRIFEYECRSLDVGLAQYRLLLYLRHGPKRAGELATQASLTRPALSTLIAGMEQDRLIRRNAVQTDRRGVRLEITRKGLETIERVEERFGRVFDDASVELDRDELMVSLGALCRQLTIDMEKRVRADVFDDRDRQR
jgi:DNA-binding MarR family transcriptional regulator